ncbi:hypothetical protein TNCV_1022131 [Trichonephila clavipes]|nr:hypothetical protein TNCV_1022131 [Trichonephila clavipes]
MDAVNSLHPECPPTCAGVEPATLGVQGQRQISVEHCFRDFLTVFDSLVDDPRAGYVNTVIMADLINKADHQVRRDRRVTLRTLAVKVDVSVGTVWVIVHGMLCYRKVSAQWVPKQLTDQQKKQRMGLLALQHLFRYHEDIASRKLPSW